MTDKTIQYGWMMWGGGSAHGPFDSYEEALVDAKTYVDLGDIITISEIVYPDFTDCLPDASTLIEQADEQAYDTYGAMDDYIFDGPVHGSEDHTQATKELKQALADWTEKWVNRNVKWCIQEGEKITIMD